MIKVSRGLNLPLSGKPSSNIESKNIDGHIGLLGTDYVGMKPSIFVKPGELVKLGQPIFGCKRNEGLIFTAPATGKVVAVHRGEKRAFQAYVIDPSATEDPVRFKSFPTAKNLAPESIRELLIESGLWTSIRERPYDKVAPVKGELPKDIFVSVADSNPASPDPLIVIKEQQENFNKGLAVLEVLAKNRMYVCSSPEQDVQLPDLKKLKQETFSGPHPSGNVGTHMHFLSPPNLNAKVWYVGYQDVISIGFLFREGVLSTSRYVGIGGPLARKPRILKTRLGVDVRQLVQGETDRESNTVRVISGSVFNGHKIADPLFYLGKYHNQITLLEEDAKRELLGWHMPGFKRFSSKRVFAASILPKPNFDLTTSTHGSKRALVPFGHFEKVCAFDTLPTQLLRALLSKDTDTAQDLGVLELGEEDMAVFTFVSTGKTDFGPILRENLDLIEKEG